MGGMGKAGLTGHCQWHFFPSQVLKKKTFMGHSSDKSSLSLGLFPPLSFDNVVMNSAVVGDVLLKWSEVCTLCLLLRTVLCDLSVRFRTLAGKWIEVSFLALI